MELINEDKKELKPLVENFYLDYAVSVITNRALPDVRDGLKPVQRRILYASKNIGLSANSSFKKSAMVVGETMGKYHSHGDTSIYDAAVNLAQPFSMLCPLIEGQGNFGNIDGNSAASMRYTEMRLSDFGDLMLEGVNNNVVPMMPNYSEDLLEPSVLPAKIPNLIVNGTSGIAVGMSATIPSHNLREVVDALEIIANNKSTTVEDIIKVMPGPDFPLGGVIRNTAGIREYYSTGRGKVTVESKWSIEHAGKYNYICFTEIPPKVKKSSIVEKIAEIIDKNLYDGLISVEDHSNMDGIRVAVQITTDVNPKSVVDYLFNKTPLMSNVNVMSVVLSPQGNPVEYNMISMLNAYLEHQKEVYKKEAENNLEITLRNIKIAEVLINASSQIKKVIDIIEKSETPEIVKEKLKKLLNADDESVEYILEMKLKRIQKIEKAKHEKELKNLIKDKEEYEKRINSSEYLLKYIIKNLKEIALKYGEERKTRITTGEDKVILANKKLKLMHDDSSVYVFNEDYKFKKSEEKQYIGGTYTDSGYYSLVVTKDGKCHIINNYELTDKVIGFSNIASIVSLNPKDKENNLYLFTKNGWTKSISFELLMKTMGRKNEFEVISLENKDQIVSALVCKPESEIIVSSTGNRFLKMSLDDVRPIGLQARGVVLIKLEKNAVVNAVYSCDNKRVLMFIFNGTINTVKLDSVSIQKRAGLGKNMRGCGIVIPANFKNDILNQEINPYIVKD